MELIKITEAKYVEEFKINLTFSDGLNSTIDFVPLLWGEIFEPLKDKNMFKAFRLNHWTIEWENGADFAPEFLHEQARKNERAFER
jgi:hypothetical protein